MLFGKKCLAVAMSALFAATPVVPSYAAMPTVRVQPVESSVNGNVETVQYSSQRRWVDRRDRNFRGRDRDFRRGDRAFRGPDRDYRRGYYRGHRGYRYARPGYRRHNGFWFPLAAFGAGAVIGGAIAPNRGYGGNSHAQWCANRYVSYRAYDNTFQPYNGPRRQCNSPYS